MSGGARRRPLLILDVDGTVRLGKDELGRFVNGPQDVAVFPEAVEMMGRWRSAGGRIVGISNQGRIALGQVSGGQVQAAMAETQRQTGYLFDCLEWCPHDPDAQHPDTARCWCRMPLPGLLFITMTCLTRKHGEYYPPSQSLFVGNRPEDEQCARAAGVDFQWALDWRGMAVTHG